MQALIFGYLFIKKKVRAFPAARKHKIQITTVFSGLKSFVSIALCLPKVPAKTIISLPAGSSFESQDI